MSEDITGTWEEVFQRNEQAEKLFKEWKTLQAGERTEADIDRQTDIGNDLYELGFLLKWEKPVWTLTRVKYWQLSKHVMAHKYRQQETYQIDGTRYVLEKGNATSTELWMLWMYPQDRFADFIAGDSIEEVFEKAQLQGVPVEKLTIEQWHD